MQFGLANDLRWDIGLHKILWWNVCSQKNARLQYLSSRGYLPSFMVFNTTLAFAECHQSKNLFASDRHSFVYVYKLHWQLFDQRWCIFQHFFHPWLILLKHGLCWNWLQIFIPCFWKQLGSSLMLGQIKQRLRFIGKYQ